MSITSVFIPSLGLIATFVPSSSLLTSFYNATLSFPCFDLLQKFKNYFVLKGFCVKYILYRILSFNINFYETSLGNWILIFHWRIWVNCFCSSFFLFSVTCIKKTVTYKKTNTDHKLDLLEPQVFFIKSWYKVIHYKYMYFHFCLALKCCFWLNLIRLLIPYYLWQFDITVQE